MKKQLSIITMSLALVATLKGFSQSENKIAPCGTYDAMEARFSADPEARRSYEASQAEFEKQYQQNKKLAGKSAAVQYTIPVVFHVLHMGGSENVSDQTVIDAVNYVNNDLAKANSDNTLTAAPFSSLYINSDIKLMLATKDPGGNCTNGIVHHVDTKKDWSQGEAFASSYWSYTWDPTKYLNVYLVASIVPQSTVTGGGIIVGYTYKPGTWSSGNAHDAIVYRSDFLGTGGTSANCRSLTHELGHWLNLSHTWGNTNNPGVACGDDNCTDTPPTKGNFTGCPSSLSGNTCAGSGGFDNVQNIMNYSDCPINFTTDQTDRMRTALASPISGRSNLITGSNHTFTGINITPNCAPICDFLSTTNTYTVCSGGNITMKSVSYNGTIASFAWSGTNGVSITAPTASQTAINFPTAGTSVITLSVSNSQGSSVATRTVTVIDGAVTVPGNYSQSFENVSDYSNWTIINPNGGSIQWDQSSITGSEGVASMYINGPSNPAGHMDYLQMPTVNPQQNNTNILSFKYAYARQTSTHLDKLEVQASVNCGGTWFVLQSWTSPALASGSGGTISTPYVPSPAEWKTQIIDDNNPNFLTIKSYPSVFIRFMFQEDATSGFGNNFYLDEVNFADPATIGINELSKSISFSLFPNPANGEATVRFSLQDQASIKIEVLDLLGKNVLPSSEYSFGPGEQNISINKNNVLAKGIYFVNLSYNGTKMSRKLIVD